MFFSFKPKVFSPSAQHVQHTGKHPLSLIIVAAFKFNQFIFALEFHRIADAPVNLKLQAMGAGLDLQFERLAIFDTADILVV